MNKTTRDIPERIWIGPKTIAMLGLADNKQAKNAHEYVCADHIAALERQVEELQVDCDTTVDALNASAAKSVELERQVAEQQAVIDKLHPRVVKLAKRGEPFVVIGVREPYFEHAYRLIRKHEKHRGTWTDDCEAAFQAAMDVYSQHLAAQAAARGSRSR